MRTSLLRTFLLASLLCSLILASAPRHSAWASPPIPDTDPDSGSMIPERLAVPELPENPTQVELGSDVYFYHCMPCHGDVGQGLTDEFRGIWVADHQNCWAPGCHGGRVGDQGFPVPKYIPGVLELPHFPTPESLYTYLNLTHPPQRPGVLSEEQYWAVTAHVLHLAGRLEADGQVGPQAATMNEALALLFMLLFLALVVGVNLLAGRG